MEAESVEVNAEKFNQLLSDVALVKEILVTSHADSEGELTDWARKEWEESRKIPSSKLISSEKVKQMILKG